MGSEVPIEDNLNSTFTQGSGVGSYQGSQFGSVTLGSLSRTDVKNPTLAAKVAKKRAETDVQLLRNRIERLKAEEARARKKVNETRRRGEEIMTLKIRNEQIHNAKNLAKEIQGDQQRRGQQQQAIRKAEQKSALRATHEAVLHARRDEVRAQRMARKDNEEACRQNRLYEQMRARRGKEAIKTHQLQVQSRMEKQREMHQEYLTQDFINMIAMEDQKRMAVEADISKMEREEEAHIERLRKLQEMQKTAYEDLEEALRE